MSSQLNNVSMVGRLVADAKLLTSAKGVDIAKICIANSVGFGENETTSFFNCSAFGASAKFISQYLTKGDLVSISGQIKVEKYTNKEGVEVSSPSINISQINSLMPSNQNKNNTSPPVRDNVKFNDDIPF